MPTLEFKGKQHTYLHHLTVLYRPLESIRHRRQHSEKNKFAFPNYICYHI